MIAIAVLVVDLHVHCISWIVYTLMFKAIYKKKSYDTRGEDVYLFLIMLGN